MLREEMELHISMSAVDKTASIFTSDPVWIRRLDKLCREHPGNYREVAERKRAIPKFLPPPKQSFEAGGSFLHAC